MDNFTPHLIESMDGKSNDYFIFDGSLPPKCDYEWIKCQTFASSDIADRKYMLYFPDGEYCMEISKEQFCKLNKMRDTMEHKANENSIQKSKYPSNARRHLLDEDHSAFVISVAVPVRPEYYNKEEICLPEFPGVKFYSASIVDGYSEPYIRLISYGAFGVSAYNEIPFECPPIQKRTDL